METVGKLKGSIGSPRLVGSCRHKEPPRGPRSSAEPRAAEGGCAVGWPKRCRAERLELWKGAEDPAVTVERGEGVG